VLLVGLVVTTPTRHYRQSPRRRAIVVALLVLVSAATLASLVLLARYLLAGSRAAGEPLIFAGGVLWPDDDPRIRHLVLGARPGWPRSALWPGWRRERPVCGRGSRTTDGVPLTKLAKSLMALESLIALTTLLLVVSRAVDILG
jgi:hypothetical protein